MVQHVSLCKTLWSSKTLQSRCHHYLHFTSRKTEAAEKCHQVCQLKWSYDQMTMQPAKSQNWVLIPIPTPGSKTGVMAAAHLRSQWDKPHLANQAEVLPVLYAKVHPHLKTSTCAASKPPSPPQKYKELAIWAITGYWAQHHAFCFNIQPALACLLSLTATLGRQRSCLTPLWDLLDTRVQAEGPQAMAGVHNQKVRCKKWWQNSKNSLPAATRQLYICSLFKAHMF